MYMVGATLMFLGITTGLNTILFLGLGLLFIVAGRVVAGNIETAGIENMVDAEETAAAAHAYIVTLQNLVEKK